MPNIFYKTFLLLQKKMKKHSIFSILLFFIGGIYSINAQDIIILKNGKTIEGNIIGIESSIIKYRKATDPDSWWNLLDLYYVIDIRYSDGTYEFNDDYSITVNERIQLYKLEKEENILAKNNEELNFGISADAGGAIPIGELTPGGISVNFEVIKNSFYSFMNISVPIDYTTKNIGFGFTGIFNYLWKSKIGDFFVGGGLGYTYLYKNSFFIFGATAGYRFVTSSGMYFSVGGFIGGEFSKEFNLYFNPILGVGYTF